MVVVLATVLGHYIAVLHAYCSWHICGGGGCVHSGSWCGCHTVGPTVVVLVAPILVKIISVMISAFIIIVILIVTVTTIIIIYTVMVH